MIIYHVFVSYDAVPKLYIKKSHERKKITKAFMG